MIQNNLSKYLLVIYFLSFMVMTGCVLGPNYKRPKVDIPDQWHESPVNCLTASDQGLSKWWQLFQDNDLDSLIAQAMQSNLDLKYATALILETRAQRQLVISDYLPNINGSGSYNRSKKSANIPSSGSSQSNSTPKTNDLFQAGFDASWEIDLFGGLKRAWEAANATIKATEEKRNGVLISLLAEVSRNYFELRALQRRLTKLDEIIEVQKQICDLTKLNYDAGLSKKLDVIGSETELNNYKAQKPSLENALKQRLNAISVLLGKNPGSQLNDLESAKPQKYYVPEIPVGLPSDLLMRRPDVRGAERELEAATARIGVAKAQYFPKLSLTGSYGYQSTELSDLLQGASKYWGFGPALRLPIFEGGKISANVKIQNAKQEEALISYQKTILNALEDVENSLVAFSKEREKNTSLVMTVDSQKTTLDINDELFRNGLADRFRSLQSQKALYQAQDQLIQSDFIITTNLVALFKALGGGWELDTK